MIECEKDVDRTKDKDQCKLHIVESAWGTDNGKYKSCRHNRRHKSEGSQKLIEEVENLIY